MSIWKKVYIIKTCSKDEVVKNFTMRIYAQKYKELRLNDLKKNMIKKQGDA